MRNQLGGQAAQPFSNPNWLSARYGKVRKGLSVARVPVHRRAARGGATSAELAPCGARSFTGGNARFPRMAALSSLHPRPVCLHWYLILTCHTGGPRGRQLSCTSEWCPRGHTSGDGLMRLVSLLVLLFLSYPSQIDIWSHSDGCSTSRGLRMQSGNS